MLTAIGNTRLELDEGKKLIDTVFVAALARYFFA